MPKVIDRPQTQSAPHPVVKSEPIHRLIYRGTTYEVPVHKPLSRSVEEVAQLMGKRLTYRGTTYEIVPAPVPEASLPQVTCKLYYRGVTYMKYAKSSLSRFDYASLA